MTKGKKWTLRLLGVAALALLICLCLLGSTMARYTSSGTGSGTLTVALWDVETMALKIEGDAVSPSDEAYGEGTGAVTGTSGARENESGWVGSFTIQNNSDVDALVTFEAGSTYTITWPDDDSLGEDKDTWAWGTGWNKCESNGGEGDDVDSDGNPVSGRAQTNAYGSALMKAFGEGETGEKAFESVVNEYGIFSLEFGFGAEFTYGDDDTPTAATDTITKLTDDYLTTNGGVKVGSKKSVNIYAEVVWTSIDESLQPTDEGGSPDSNMAPSAFNFKDDEGEEDWETFSDAVDTILGMYAQKLTFGVSWTAVQASTLPE